MAPAYTRMGIESDALLNVFWTARFQDPDVFPNDLIADYFQSVSPLGYNTLYRVLAQVSDPLVISRLLPPVLGLVTAAATFLLVRRLHPAPAVAFVASVLLSWYFWHTEDLAKGTQHGFMPPLLGAILASVAAGRLLLSVGLVALGASFYPATGLLGVALLGVRQVRFCGRWPTLSRDRSGWLAFLAAGVLVGAVLLPTLLASSRFGPTVSAAQALSMPAFGQNGRRPIFAGDWYQFWVVSGASGLGVDLTDPLEAAYLGGALLLPLLLLSGHHLSSVRRLGGRSVILLQLLVASLGLFILAHLVLFRLHLPGRYVATSLPFVLTVATALVVGIVFEEIGARLGQARRGLVLSGSALALGVVLAVHPGNFPASFTYDRHPAITAYLRAQPKDVLVAGMGIDTDSVPGFSLRSVLTSRKHAIPYHLGYYEEMRRRTEALLDAYYAESTAQVADFAATYGVDVFLVNEAAFDRRRLADLVAVEPFRSTAFLKQAQSNSFALLTLARRCAAVRDGPLSVVPTSCLNGS